VTLKAGICAINDGRKTKRTGPAAFCVVDLGKCRGLPQKRSRRRTDVQAIFSAQLTYSTELKRRISNMPTATVAGIVVPLEGAGRKLTSTISSPIQVHGVTKVSARRAPELGEHNDEILKDLGFDAKTIDGLRASGAVPKPKAPMAAAHKPS
jgi:hypothetical protein